MANTSPRILIIEDEYLIAMDAERILNDALSCTVVLTTRKEFMNLIAGDPFHVVLLDTGPSIDRLNDDIARITRTGAAVIVTTSDNEFLSGAPTGEKFVVLGKPYDDEQLVGIVRKLTGSAS